MGLPNAFDISYDDWLSIFGEIGQPSYRAGQICGWLWRRGAADPSEMTDFSKALRERLAAMFDFTPPSIEGESRADDGTRKFVLRLSDGEEIETAVLKQGDRITACLSTQVGCPVSCPFCATGAGGFERSMSCGEIASQLVVIEKFLGREANNVVFMGMGEPFLNTDATLGAVRVLNNPKMRGLGIRHMTISTAGVIPGIKALAESGLGVRLAVSLHAASDDLRDELVPCNTSYPLGELIPALREYQTTTGDRITIEYAMFRGKHDSLDHARSL
ncbi:MAG: 23S rRNA (adenine(2503)-C(2))-methyltransferase RlmN, partial [Synergistaceae bacterium]|nr:23S rRNA (adenine(2503)-C(2))-methyltransferase RlmN [Synergistaceae bacterium]